MRHSCNVAALLLAAFPAQAGDLEDRMATFVTDEVKAWFSDPTVVAMVQEANLGNAALTSGDIDALEARWQAEVGTNGELVAAITDNAASVYLRERIMASGGKVTELIVMDARGLNVAVSEPTSDYWQGDEAKYRQTYLVGPAGLHVSEVELDMSTQIYQAQVSFALTEPTTGQPIGAVTVGLNAESF